MSAQVVTITGAWEAFADAIDPVKAMPRLERNMTIGLQRIGRQFVRQARLAIQSREYAPNAAITIILKGSSAPLVAAGGDLFQALTFAVAPGAKASTMALRLGITRQRSGEEIVNIGWILHEGAEIDTNEHPQVRAAVFAKVAEALGNVGKLSKRSREAVRKAAGGELGESVAGPPGVWIIPPRPFILNITETPQFQGFARKHITGAVRAAFFGGA